MSTTLPSTFSLIEPIPGYFVRERLGAGGYGEVWKAEAPGGLIKAIKVVYGCRDDVRASRELSALNRIKQVRHPFLLSLERIELIDGHLVIVTELATSNLKQEFEQCRATGLAGLPRNEILSHLQDAADALDYISQEFSLQHLDVKPENLLLVGGRIKVADFGLVKDLQDVNSSMIGGMTPVYAAPELFDGRPSIHSDQYSLAIVYQEMLTGVLPYEGRTTAQLAAQHLHSRPRLDRLPTSDQPTIERALSKDPDQRFGSCREMIDSLLDTTANVRPRVSRAPARGKAAPAPAGPRFDTEVLSRDDIQAARQAAGGGSAINGTQVTDTPLTVHDLPALELSADEIDYRPTIFVGVGGLATKALQSLYHRVGARFGDPAALPALQFLLFETDPDTVKTATDASTSIPLPDSAFVLLPLRQSADYRSDLSGRFNWLSRRWIYNIPRNSQTQGLRPLGRLTLVDHMERAVERMTQAVRAATDPAALATTASTTGLPFQNAVPRIIIVSSTTGGTGSGMALDLGYVARQTLRELGLPDDSICGVLAHCSGRTSQGRELAVANAYAFLGELNHYSDSQHIYPGDPTCGLSAFSPDDAPFNHAYVVHLGEELDSEGFAGAVDTLAKYLYYNAVTGAGKFFDKSRAIQSAGRSSASAAPTVRSFQLCQLGFSPNDLPTSAAEELCAALIARWRGADLHQPDMSSASLADPTSLLATHFATGISPEDFHATVVTQAEKAGIQLQSVLASFHTALAEQMGNDREAYLLSALGELLNHFAPKRGFLARIPPSKVIVEALDAMIRHQGAQDANHLCMESALDAPLAAFVASAVPPLQEWLLGLVNSPDHRLVGAQRAADALAEHLRDLSRQAGAAIQSTIQELRSIKDVLLNDRKGSKHWVRFKGMFGNRRLVADKRLSNYFQLRLHELTLDTFCQLIGQILAQVATAGDKLRNMASDFNRLTERFRSASTPSEMLAARPLELYRVAIAQITVRKAELVAEMEESLEDQLRLVTTTDVRDVRGMLAVSIRQTSRKVILQMLKQFALQEMAAGLRGEPHHPLFEILDGLKEAGNQRLSGCGGQRRLLVVAPESLAPEILAKNIGDEIKANPTVLADPDNDVFICYEVEDQPLRRVAAAILDQRYHAVEVASRLHTRMDVPWTPL